MGNVLARGQSLVIDVDKGEEVWNQPVDKFQSSINGNLVTSKIEYTVETQQAWEAHPAVTESKTIMYTLDLAAGSRIVGGAYAAGELIDFAWLMSPPAFGGYFSGLARVYGASTGAVVSGTSLASLAGNTTEGQGIGVWMPETGGTDGYWLKMEARPWVAPALLDQAQVLTEPSGLIQVSSFARPSTHVWLVRPTNHSGARVLVEAPRTNTLPPGAMVKVYESHACDGPLVLTMHAFTGDASLSPEEQTVEVEAPFCFVFEAPSAPSANESSLAEGGFEVRYQLCALGSDSTCDRPYY